MSRSWSRREFLKAGGAGAVAAVGVGFWVSFAGKGGAVRCGRCGGEFRSAHEHEEAGVNGIYCPHCGIELRRLEYDLPESLGFPGGKAKAGRRGKKVEWDSAAVPFPNRELAMQSAKPAVRMADIRLRPLAHT